MMAMILLLNKKSRLRRDNPITLSFLYTANKKHPNSQRGRMSAKKVAQEHRGSVEPSETLATNFFKLAFNRVGLTRIEFILFMHFLLHLLHAFFNTFTSNKGCDGQWNRHD